MQEAIATGMTQTKEEETRNGNALTRFFRQADLLALGFGTTVGMWAVGYVCRHPAVMLPSPLVLPLMLACILAGGFLTGRYTRRGWKGGLVVGTLSALLNLLILGSLLSGEQPNAIRTTALLWLPGSLLLSALTAALGASLGQNASSQKTDSIRWTAVFTEVAAVATFFLLIVGGLVTGKQAGLAVVDWPNSFGYNMFLYPLSRMTGGIYYEHAHRLFGSLVGLCTVAAAIHLTLTDSRVWLKRLALAAVALVIFQGILGGLRVTGVFTLSTSPEDVRPNIYLAVLHGVVGQVFFAVLVALAVFSTRSWLSPLRRTVRSSATSDHILNVLLVVLVVVQLVYGAVLRHISGGLIMHISLASLIALNAVGSGARAWGLYVDQPILQRLGLWLISLMVLQIVLGLAALVAVGFTISPERVSVIDIAVTTAHQANGAALLAVSVMLLLWSFRLLTTEETP